MDLRDQAALVTGAGSGLGEATARALAAAGARVALLDFNLPAAEAVATEIGGLAIGCDVASAESAEAAVARAAAEQGVARILVNCAGVAPAKKMLGRAGVMPLEEFRRTVEVNLVGSFNLLRLFAAGAAELAPLETGERGVAIHTASVAAWEGQIGQTAYAASKGGIVGLTLPAARELAPLGIRVCAIAPGIFETAMLKGLPEAAQESLGAAVPFPSRLGRPAEFAALALHILSNPMLNGETIRLDGALRMAPK
ncbi:SDR family NAD(P)-dependent oxidoreductase [Cereibacter sphaeroides]|uniref:SDR family NAD(P)-dependent oxidoreductase n=1 Tax=Cereibacter sphaeroides TaxID=1063 RepID=UPI000F540573|nr:SDR family NAD(P)-dependent oxidoreductase [Cereibacter sphaeroides]AZB57075.1 SDR family NAD(P)-dependent oxidoreductase [Cereibacter sphaeroides]AZB61366.1 SDR family NAD(P)-dependent oxidoreductase [Cereibacter sphaeroides]